MTRHRCTWIAGLLAAALFATPGCEEKPPPQSEKPPGTQAKPSITLQLNGPHSPRFAAHYLLAASTALPVQVRQGGPSTNPLSEVLAGRAQFAVAEVDLFLKYLGENLAAPGKSDLVCVFVDLQRNPVGWVIHPDVARKLGLTEAASADAKQVNKWAADLIRTRRLKVGDRRGTGTTAVWLQWRAKHALGPDTPAVSVGSDPAILLAAPMLLYPVSLDVQPFELSERMRQDNRGEVVVVDPAADGVCLYGDVVVARRDLTAADPALVETFQQELRRAWEAVKADPQRAADQVQARYTAVPLPIILRQVRRTLDFAFAGGNSPGQMDQRADGTWVRTLRALQDAGSADKALTPEQVLGALVPPK